MTVARATTNFPSFMQLSGATSGKVTLGTGTTIHTGLAGFVDRVELTFLNVTAAPVEVIIDTGAAMANYSLTNDASLSIVLAVDGAATIQGTGSGVEVVGCVTRGIAVTA